MMAGCLFCERNGQLEDSGIAAVATDPDCRVSVRVVGACLSPEDTGRLRPQTAGAWVEDQREGKLEVLLHTENMFFYYPSFVGS